MGITDLKPNENMSECQIIIDLPHDKHPETWPRTRFHNNWMKFCSVAVYYSKGYECLKYIETLLIRRKKIFQQDQRFNCRYPFHLVISLHLMSVFFLWSVHKWKWNTTSSLERYTYFAVLETRNLNHQTRIGKLNEPRLQVNYKNNRKSG